jgi:hypothetical protein
MMDLWKDCLFRIKKRHEDTDSQVFQKCFGINMPKLNPASVFPTDNLPLLLLLLVVVVVVVVVVIVVLVTLQPFC